MLPYFPIQQDQFKMTMGTQALSPERLIEVDLELYQQEIHLKEELLTTEHACYFQGPAETLPLQWETLALLLSTLAQRYPAYFTLTSTGERWRWQNALLESDTTFTFGDTASLPLLPLDWVGRQIQEDLLLLTNDREKGFPLVAGQLCFPNDWCLKDKMELSFLDIHRPVPLFAEELGRSTSLLLERLKVERPVWRTNWGFKGSSRLNLLPRYAEEQRQHSRALTAANIGERCMLRTERQTLSRLPQSQAILFTIHTYQAPIANEIHSAEQAQRILKVLQSTPESMRHYKGMQSFYALLLGYLQTHC